MGLDLLWALPIGVIGGWSIGAVFGSRRRARRPAARLLALFPILALVAAAGHSHAFDGYRSDLWVYLTVAERVADGQWLLGREPYRLVEPGGPHHSLNWLLVGLLMRGTGIDGHTWVLALRGVALVLLSLGAWRLAGRASDDPAVRGLAVACFWCATPQLWTEIGLNRSFSGIYLLFATASAFRFAGRARGGAALAALVALAFWTHFFGGLLTLGGVGLAWLGRRLEGDAPPTRRLALAIGAGLALASPWIALYLAKAGAPIAESYLWGPGQQRLLGLRWLDPLRLLREISPPLWLLAGVGLLGPAARRLRPPVRSACRIGAAVVLLVLLTPLYHLWSERLGGWLALRLLALAFLWLPAAAALAALLEARGARWRVAVGTALAMVLVGLGAARVVRDFRQRDIYAAFTPAARAEARALRPLLAGRSYLSLPTLAYALAPHTLGHPVAVPPGRASPFHDFDARDRRVRSALRVNTEACWSALLAAYPGITYLVTPAAEARDENALWRADVPEHAASAVRETLGRVVRLEPVHRGAHYAVDRVRPQLAEDALPADVDCLD